MYESPFLNLYLFPEAADYRARDQLAAHVAPARLERARPTRRSTWTRRSPGDAPLVYLSLGSLGSADVELMQRLIDVLGTTRTA